MNPCKHGSLRRSCETCAAEAELEATRQLLDRLRDAALVCVDEPNNANRMALRFLIEEQIKQERSEGR